MNTAKPQPMSLFPWQCDDFVAEYEPLLVEILVQVMDPSFVCSVSLTGCLAMYQHGCCLPGVEWGQGAR